MQFVLVLSLVFALVVAVFAMQNATSVQVAFLAWEATTSVALVILGAAALGAGAVGLLGFMKQFGLGMRLRNAQSKLRKQQEQLEDMEEEKAQLLAQIEELKGVQTEDGV